MDKKRRTLTLSEQNDQFLADKDNASAFVDRLLTEFRGEESVEQMIQRYRLKKQRKELDRLRDSVEIQEELVAEMEDKTPDKEQQRENKIEWYAHKVHLEETLGGTLEPRVTDQRLAELADEAGCTVDELVMKAKEIHHE